MRGFTLIELLVSMSIFTALLLGLYGILGSGNAIFQRDTILVDLQADARNAMERIVREVRESKSSTVGVGTHDITFDTPNEVGIKYSLSGTRLIREYPAGTQKTVASTISTLTFAKSGKLLTVDVVAQKTYRSTTYSFPLREEVRLRNE